MFHVTVLWHVVFALGNVTVVIETEAHVYSNTTRGGNSTEVEEGSGLHVRFNGFNHRRRRKPELTLLGTNQESHCSQKSQDPSIDKFKRPSKVKTLRILQHQAVAVLFVVLDMK